MTLELIAAYGAGPTLVGPHAGRLARRHILRWYPDIFYIDMKHTYTFDLPVKWARVDKKTNRIEYVGPPPHEVVPAFAPDVENGEKVPLHSVGVIVSHVLDETTRFDARDFGWASHIFIDQCNFDMVDVRGMCLRTLRVHNVRRLCVARLGEGVKRAVFVNCPRLKLVDDVGDVEVFALSDVNRDLRVQGREAFSGALKRFRLEPAIASIPLVPHMPPSASDTTRCSYDATRVRMQREAESTWLVLVWHAGVGGTRTSPRHPHLLRYAVTFL